IMRSQSFTQADQASGYATPAPTTEKPTSTILEPLNANPIHWLIPHWQLQPACAPSAGCNRQYAVEPLDKVPRLKAITEAPPELSAGKPQRSPTSSRPVSTTNWLPRHPQQNQPAQQ
ncbi:hypothetical protein, partial [Pseudomonas aeruginosa]|uniref:hypothetical protein n=1 Tax=Pseudomonas aeruginosa TaxID=287 RepID=UPI001C2CC87E